MAGRGLGDSRHVAVGVTVRPDSPEAFGKFPADERRKFPEVVNVSAAIVD